MNKTDISSALKLLLNGRIIILRKGIITDLTLNITLTMCNNVFAGMHT